MCVRVRVCVCARARAYVWVGAWVGAWVGVSLAAMNSQKTEIGASNFNSNFRAITLQAEKNAGRFIKFSVITNIYNKKTKGSNLMEFSQPQGK